MFPFPHHPSPFHPPKKRLPVPNTGGAGQPWLAAAAAADAAAGADLGQVGGIEQFDIFGCGSKSFWDPILGFSVNSPPMLVHFSGDLDVH